MKNSGNGSLPIFGERRLGKISSFAIVISRLQIIVIIVILDLKNEANGSCGFGIRRWISAERNNATAVLGTLDRSNGCKQLQFFACYKSHYKIVNNTH